MNDIKNLKFFQSSIFKSITVMLLSMSFIILGATYVFTQRQTKMIIEWSFTTNNTQLQQIMTLANNELAQFGSRLEMLSKSSEVMSMDPIRSAGYLKSYNISTLFYSGEPLTLFDSKGQEVCNNSMLKGPIVKYHINNQITPQRYKASNWFRDNNSDPPQKTFGIGVANSSQGSGKLLSNFTSRRLWKIFTESNIEKNKILVATNKNGEILYHNDLKKWLSESHNISELGLTNINLQNTEFKEAQFVELENKKQYLISYVYNQFFDLGIFSFQPKSDIDQLEHSIKIGNFIILGASILMFLLLAIWMYIYMGKPMGSLIKHIWKITKGDLTIEEIKVGNRKDEIGILARTFNVMHGTIKRQIQELNTHRELLEQEVKERTRDLEAANKKLDIISRTDELTGLPNRRDINNTIEKEVCRSERTEKPFCFVFIDIDHFKQINDTYGHGCGDLVLRTVAQSIRSMLRRYDVLARYGGEEFLTLLPETNLEGARSVAERFRKKVEAEVIKYADHTIHVTITLGVSLFDKRLGPSRSIQIADKALYEGKENGRNKVVVWDPARTTEEDYRAAAIEMLETLKAKNKALENAISQITKQKIAEPEPEPMPEISAEQKLKNEAMKKTIQQLKSKNIIANNDLIKDDFPEE